MTSESLTFIQREFVECDVCGAETLIKLEDYDGITVKLRECTDCGHGWLPWEEEQALDRALRERETVAST